MMPGSFATNLDPENYLLKISQRLTGKWPTPKEYNDLTAQMSRRSCSEIKCMEDYFKAYIDKKMSTPEFYSEATLKVHERFALQTPYTIPFPLVANDSGTDESSSQALLVYRTIKQNLPVDELFISQVVTRTGPKVLSDSAAARNLIEIESETVPKAEVLSADPGVIPQDAALSFDYAGHPNVSGFFTTNKFLTRYWNTPINNGRKRAAAVFKVMLCDPMVPALERVTAKARENALAQGATESTMTTRTIEEIHRDRHGNQKDCAQCHNRLDPLARTMRPLELGVSKFASRGRLRFYDATNQPVDHPAANFHDLIVKITQQQKYNDCQMNWLFRWIVGKDVNVHPQRFADLLGQFEKDGRRMKETIAKLLLSPEFRGETVSFREPVSYKAARDVLNNCYECHSPFLKSHGAELKLTLSKIAYKLDLAHDGQDRLMPPNYHFWAPSKEQVLSVKTWIQEGAPLIEGMPLLNGDEVMKMLDPGVAR